MSNEELCTAIKNGQNELIETLWKQCYFFIKKEAARWFFAWSEKRGGFELDDLIQSGYFAIVKAVQGFQVDRGSTFINYLALCLKTEFSKVVGCYKEKQLEDPINNSISFDEPIAGDSDGLTVGGTLGAECAELEEAEERIYKSQLAKAVRDAVASLPERQQKAIEGHYFKGLSYAAIADELSVSNSRAGQIVNEGIKALRKSKKGADLYSFYDGKRNFYSGTGFQAWKDSGMSVPERELLRKETIQQKYNFESQGGRLLYCIKEYGMTESEAKEFLCKMGEYSA